MISLDDIEDMTCLTREEIAAIAAHEHEPEIIAALQGEYMMHIHKGPQRIQQMICDDIQAALRRGDVQRARALFATLRHFIAEHPEAVRGSL